VRADDLRRLEEEKESAWQTVQIELARAQAKAEPLWLSDRQLIAAVERYLHLEELREQALQAGEAASFDVEPGSC